MGRTAVPAPTSLDVPPSSAGEDSTLWLNPSSFTALAQPVVAPSGAFCLHRLPSSRSSSRPPRRSALPGAVAPVLWPLLTPAAPTRLRSRACCPQTAGRQFSPGKNADFPCNPAPSTLPALDYIGLRCPLPARPADPACLCVRTQTGLVWDSCSSKRRFASGLLRTPAREDALAFGSMTLGPVLRPSRSVQSTSVIETLTLKSAPMLGAQPGPPARSRRPLSLCPAYLVPVSTTLWVSFLPPVSSV
jgi:hypothetical protein